MLKWSKGGPAVKKYDKVLKENEMLVIQLNQSIKKLMTLESKRSNLEDQQTQQESQIIGHYSRTMQSEVGEHNFGATNRSREVTQGSNSKNQPPRDRKKENNALAKMATLFKDILVVLYKELEVEVPPVENLEDGRWNGFSGKLRQKLVDYKLLGENGKDAADNYKIMLNEKCLELVEITAKYKTMSEHIERMKSQSRSESFDIKGELADFMNDSEEGMQRQLSINVDPQTIGGTKSANLSLDQNLGTNVLVDSKSRAKGVDPEEHKLLRDNFTKCLEDNADLKEQNTGLKLDIDSQRLRVGDLGESCKNLTSMEEMYMKQTEIQKAEIVDLRKKMKNLDSGKEKDHIRESFVQWQTLLAKQDEKESTLLDVLLIHLNVNPGDKGKITDQLSTLKTLFVKKKKGWF